MKINRVYKYRVYPTDEQVEELEYQFELCRRLFNKALWWREGEYQRAVRAQQEEEESANTSSEANLSTANPADASSEVTQEKAVSSSCEDSESSNSRSTSHESSNQAKQLPIKKRQMHALTDLRHYDPRYKDVAVGALEDVLTRVHNAYNAFFRRCKAGEKPGYPKSKHPGNYNSINIPRQREFKFEYHEGKRFSRLSFKGIEGLKVRMHRPFPEGANVRRVLIKKESNNHWYACFGWDIEREPLQRIGPPIGLDVGLTSFVTDSNGTKVDPPRNYRLLEEKLAKVQQELSRKKKGSNRRKKAKNRVAVVHAQIRNRRRDFLHNLSRAVVDEYSFIALEDLNIQGMTQNRYLSKSILDAGWGEFAHMLRYKTEEIGGKVVMVNPKNTSQMCSGCGELPEEKKTLADRVHTCACGLELDRDHNAAINILNLGLAS